MIFSSSHADPVFPMIPKSFSFLALLGFCKSSGAGMTKEMGCKKSGDGRLHVAEDDKKPLANSLGHR